MELKDKVAIITGGNSGIGYATAELFLKEGAKVIILARREDACREAVESLKEFGEITGHVADMQDKKALEAAVALADEKYGKINILVNNAGMALVKDIASTTDEEYDTVMNVNVRGVFYLCRAAIPVMKRSGGGSIINVGSQLSVVSAPNFGVYTATKGAVLNMTRSMALDYAKDNIRVNILCPGAVATPLLLNQFEGKEGPQGSLDDLKAMHPMGRLGKPEELAYGALFLASDRNGFMTGQPLIIDGGYTAW